MLKKATIVISILIGFVFAFYAGVLYNWMSTTEVKFAKHYVDIVVEEGEVVDASTFLEPTGKYEVLAQIDEPMRKTIALYMEANKLKLCSGKHRFNRVSGTLDEYLNENFKFEKNE